MKGGVLKSEFSGYHNKDSSDEIFLFPRKESRSQAKINFPSIWYYPLLCSQKVSPYASYFVWARKKKKRKGKITRVIVV